MKLIGKIRVSDRKSYSPVILSLITLTFCTTDFLDIEASHV